MNKTDNRKEMDEKSNNKKCCFCMDWKRYSIAVYLGVLGAFLMLLGIFLPLFAAGYSLFGMAAKLNMSILYVLCAVFALLAVSTGVFIFMKPALSIIPSVLYLVFIAAFAFMSSVLPLVPDMGSFFSSGGVGFYMMFIGAIVAIVCGAVGRIKANE